MAESRKVAKVTFAGERSEYFGRLSIELAPGEQYIANVEGITALAAADPRVTFSLVDETAANEDKAKRDAERDAEIAAAAAKAAPPAAAATSSAASSPEPDNTRARRAGR